MANWDSVEKPGLLMSVWHIYFSHRRNARIKNFFFTEVDRSAQKPGGTPLSNPPRSFLGPLVAILDFAVLYLKTKWNLLPS